jgi:hypothetical protein
LQLFIRRLTTLHRREARHPQLDDVGLAVEIFRQLAEGEFVSEASSCWVTVTPGISPFTAVSNTATLIPASTAFFTSAVEYGSRPERG